MLEKKNQKHCDLLSYYDTSVRATPIIPNYLVIYDPCGSPRQANSNKTVMFRFFVSLWFHLWRCNYHELSNLLYKRSKPSKPNPTPYGKNERKHPLPPGKKGNEYFVITTCVIYVMSRQHMLIKLVMLIWND